MHIATGTTHRRRFRRILTIPASRVLAGVVLAAVVLCGCRLDITRARTGRRLQVDKYEDYEPGTTTIPEVIDELGAPEDIRWELGKSRLTWEYLDETRFQTRLQLPIAFFGYRHNLFTYFQSRDQTNRMELLFDREGTLEQKSLHQPKVFREVKGTGWRLQFTPRVEHSIALFGDADIADFDDIFDNGYGAGFDVGLQIFAPLTISVGGRYNIFDGRSVVLSDGRRVAFDDLELFTAEALFRVQIPLKIFGSVDSVKNAWAVLLDADPASHDGPIAYIEAGLGGTVNGNVPVAINGVRSGSFFAAGPVFSNSLSGGLEYSWANVSARVGVTLRTFNAFNDGDAALPADVNSLQSVLGTASLAIKF